MRFDKWNIAGFDREKAAQMCTDEKYPINPLIALILASRGITTAGDAAGYLDIRSIPLHDGHMMADMDKAVLRIREAVANKEHIAIYGDYDVDGMTSAALLALWLETKAAKYDIYIPERFNEGYGLNSAALDKIKAKGATLVITVDCGITATAEAEHAGDIGLDLIITDHHECMHEGESDMPKAIAVVDPKRPDCKYPFKDLAGVGVVFKLICVLEDEYGTDELIDRYGQLVALGTVADVMPIKGENRRLIVQGLDVINKNPGPGLKELINEAYADTQKITAVNISFGLAPRLNASGRMGDAMLSVKLLLAKDNAEAKEYISELCRLNDERKDLEQEIYNDAVSKLTHMLAEEDRDTPTEPIILAGENWNQGVSGIVAAKMADRYRMPVIIISIDDSGVGKGSSRSFGTFPIYEALSKCSGILETFGGHDMAAGITIKAENIAKLREKITECYNAHIAKAPATGLDIDFEVEKPGKLLTIENVQELKKLEPFGRENPPPRLCIKSANLVAVSSVGSGKHTKLRIEKPNPGNTGKPASSLDCIMFSATPADLGVTVGDTVDIAFEPQINEYRDRTMVQLQLLDIRKA